jgi:hypothetical protein
MLTQQRRQHANPKCGKEQADAMPEGYFGWRGLTEMEPNPLRIGYNTGIIEVKMGASGFDRTGLTLSGEPRCRWPR